MTYPKERLTGQFEFFSVFPLALPVTVSIRKDPNRSHVSLALRGHRNS